MGDMIGGLAAFIVYLVVMRFVLPRFGVQS